MSKLNRIYKLTTRREALIAKDPHKYANEIARLTVQIDRMAEE